MSSLKYFVYVYIRLVNSLSNTMITSGKKNCYNSRQQRNDIIKYTQNGSMGRPQENRILLDKKIELIEYAPSLINLTFIYNFNKLTSFLVLVLVEFKNIKTLNTLNTNSAHNINDLLLIFYLNLIHDIKIPHK